MAELTRDEGSFTVVEHNADEHLAAGLLGERKKCVQTPWGVGHRHVEQQLALRGEGQRREADLPAHDRQAPA
jgi:hypothetical protein